jgi:A/G-specific adenine glycosylase
VINKILSGPVQAFSEKLLAWYDVHRRDLPWRAAPDETPDPYRVWLSEIMLQQTTVTTVTSYFVDFVARWPKTEDLAAAELDDILHAWQGLGYYSRARNLHKCAKIVLSDHGGAFPKTEAALATLPGIGPYTAAAVAAIAFGLKATPVDGNIERVMARLYAIRTPLPKAKVEIKQLAENLTPDSRAGDYAQALMDLGATVCRPKVADCDACPLVGLCQAQKCGDPQHFPVRTPKKPRPTRHGVVFWLQRGDGAVLVQRREEKGLLGGMMEFPSTPWIENSTSAAAIDSHAPAEAVWRELPGEVVHVFTHFRLVLTVRCGAIPDGGGNMRWCKPEDFGTLALPTVMKKVAQHMAAAN